MDIFGKNSPKQNIPKQSKILDNINDRVIDDLKETIKKGSKVSIVAAFKDSSFIGSAAKINLSEHFRIICPDTKVKVI